MRKDTLSQIKYMGDEDDLEEISKIFTDLSERKIFFENFLPYLENKDKILYSKLSKLEMDEYRKLIFTYKNNNARTKFNIDKYRLDSNKRMDLFSLSKALCL